MQIKKNEVHKILILFLFLHLIIWTVIPSVSNSNLPLDTIEALAWGSNLDWGFNKHPPLSAFAVDIFYEIFGNQDWAYYLLSQIFVVLTFFIVFKFSENFFKNKIYSLLSVLLLEAIYFYNYTTPEFNVNVCQLPFWALSVFYCWKGLEKNKATDWFLFGFFAGLGVLSKYLFIYLLIAIDILFIYFLINKKIKLKCLISLIPFFLVLLPHIFWLIENDFITITYALHRTGVGDLSFIQNHLLNPFTFLGKQIGILIPFFILFIFIISKIKLKLNYKDKKLLYLMAINVIPLALMFFTSLFMGAKIRTMWMTPFYLFFGVFLVYIFQEKIKLYKQNYFISVFLILFIFSPFSYLYVSISQTDKRTDYPGKKIAEQIQNKFANNFEGEIDWVIGDEWHGGNLSYHLKSRPKWFYVAGNLKLLTIDKSTIGNVATIGFANDDTLKKFLKLCDKTDGKSYIIEKIGFCLNGVEKK